jgi:hypothetical protein
VCPTFAARTVGAFGIMLLFVIMLIDPAGATRS